MIRNLLLLTLSVAAFCTVASPTSQAQGWGSDPAVLTAPYVAYAGPGFYYPQDIAIRGGQQELYFGMGTAVVHAEARVVEPFVGSWETIHTTDDPVQHTVLWPGAPTLPGAYRVEIEWRGLYYQQSSVVAYDLFVVPPAQQGYIDFFGNTMVLWAGTTPALDQPFLVVEGIDAADENGHSLYYALGADLFNRGRQRGADVLVLDFDDGGADLRTNAQAVEEAIQFLNGARVGSRKMDVAGLSMGGVVTRYALADMESRGVAHDVQRFVSMDAPQQGAVIDHGLQQYLNNHVPSEHWPENLTSTAGKQLLKYNVFDNSALHSQFYTEIGRLNGDGYPNQTVENVGVSFGTSAPNPNTGADWLDIYDNVYSPGTLPDETFDIEANSAESVGGSFLPRTSTEVWVRKFGWYEAEFERLSDPTFIPYDSALDIVNGQSAFDGALITANGPEYHDTVPAEIVEPLLARLGYPRPPLAASVSGPDEVTQGDTHTWHADPSAGYPPYTYQWEWKYTCSGGGGFEPHGSGGAEGGGGATTNAPTIPCSPTVHDGGTQSGLTITPPEHGTLVLTVEVTDASGDFTEASKTVNVRYSFGGFQSEGPSASMRSSATPDVYALEGAAPNPFGALTTIRFSTPEAADVRLVVYDSIGREVDRLVDGPREAGYHRAHFDGTALPTGIYVVRLEAVGPEGEHAESRRVTLVR